MVNKRSLAILGCLISLAFSLRTTNAEEPNWTPVYQGVDLATYTVDSPKQRFVVARVDRQAEGVEFLATPPNKDFAPEERETYRQTTAMFLKEQGLTLAVNANFYNPFGASTISVGGDSNLIGLGVSDGFVESAPQANYPSFIVKKDGDVEIRQVAEGENLDDVQQAVSGNVIVLQDGKVAPSNDKSVHPRTAVGYSQDKRFVYFLVVDGRQRGYSEGATTTNVGEVLLECGAYVGLNLDGGGSTTMVARDENDEPVVLNRPCNGTKDRLRFNANAIGVRAKGKPSKDVREFSAYEARR